MNSKKPRKETTGVMPMFIVPAIAFILYSCVPEEIFVIVKSDPTFAQVYLDSIPQGITPTILTLHPSHYKSEDPIGWDKRTHSIEVAADGYERFQHVFTLKSYQPISDPVRLRKNKLPPATAAVTERPDSIHDTSQQVERLKEEVIDIEQRLMDAVAPGDTATWIRYLDAAFQTVVENGSTLTRSEFLGSLRPLPKGYSGSIHVSDPSVEFRGGLTLLNYTADESESVFGQQLHTKYSVMSVYQKADTTWKLVRSQIFEVPQLPPAISLSVKTLRKYAGSYQLADSIYYIVTVEGDRLFGQRTARKKEELIPEVEGVFYRKSDTRGRKLFLPDKNGRLQMIERRYSNDVVWKKVG